MAESRGELEVYNQWFVAADLDRDGVLSGLEAVQFFQRSGLPQNPTLFKVQHNADVVAMQCSVVDCAVHKVWQYVAGDRPALSRQEFYTSMKLVSLAQLNSGQLDDQQALRLVNGLAGPVPLPRMAGMTVPRGIELPAHMLPPEPAVAAWGAAPTATRAASPAPGGAPSPTRPAAQPVSPVPAPSAFPPLAGEQAAAFQTAFSQLDTDRDGYVQGTDCFGAFMHSGLPKASLKQIWDLVAGDEPRLNRHQFVQALYLVDCVKRGMPVPAALPPGPFPPVVGTVNMSSLSVGTPTDIYSATLVIPPMAPRQTYHPQPPPPMPFASQVPGLPADRLAALDQAERMRLEAEREAALAKEVEQRRAEEERAAAAAKHEFFTRALGDLRLAQSKVNRVVVEAQQRCEMEQAAAEQMEADYNRAYAEFSLAHAQSTPLVQALEVAQANKAALAAKLESLRAMVAQLEEFDPEWESREKGECEALNLEVAELTVHKEQLQRRVDAMGRKREAMLAQIVALKEAATGMDAELATMTEQVDKVAAEGSEDKEAVVNLLKKVAPLYNKLYDAAKAAMVPLPAEAVATMKREASPFQYDSLLAAAASDWGTFKNEGFKIVSALPVDTRLTTYAAPSVAALDKDEAEAAAAASVAPAAEGGLALAADLPATAAPASPGKVLKSAASVAEAEAMSTATEADVLASAIAEALSSAPAKPASKQGSLSASSGVAAATTEEEEQQRAAAAGTAGDAAAPVASDPFKVGFGDGSEAVAVADAFAAFGTATAVPEPAPIPPVKQASGAFGSTQALVVESPKAADAAGTSTTAEDGAGGEAVAAAPADGWTAF